MKILINSHEDEEMRENDTPVIKTVLKGHFCPGLKKKVTSVRKKTVLSPNIWIMLETHKKTLLSPKRHF